jgi:hypothetical protein
MDQEEKELGFMVMEALTLLLSHNQKNASELIFVKMNFPNSEKIFFIEIFREHGGARLAHNIIPYRLCRIAALTVVLHLVLCIGGEDDTGTLLGLIHTAKLEELEMKSVILKVNSISMVMIKYLFIYQGISLYPSRKSSNSYCISKSWRFCVYRFFININGWLSSSTTETSMGNRYKKFFPKRFLFIL